MRPVSVILDSRERFIVPGEAPGEACRLCKPRTVRAKLHATISEETINKAVDRLLQVSKPQKIFLFGSYARGDAREHSDLDFLVVERDVKSRRKEMVRLHDALRSLRIPVDIVVAPEATFEKWCDVPGTVFHEAKTKGRLCYKSP